MKIRNIIIAVFILSNFSVQSQLLPSILCKTSLGEIIIEIDTIHAPVTAKNFLTQVIKGTYKNAFFYRVVNMNNQPQNKIKIEVIQGGLLDDSEIKLIPAIIHETTKQTGLKHLDGTISMARDKPGTASTEFFICIGDQPELDFGGKRNPDGQGFAAFGRVKKGMDVVRKIQQQKDTNQMLNTPVKILEMKIIE